MTVTKVASVAEHILTEMMGEALGPLFRKYRLLQFLNRSNIDGDPSLKRVIPVQDAIAAAYPDVEGAELSNGAEVNYAASVELTPVGYAQLIELTIKAIRRRMPGATRQTVIQAIENGDPSTLPLVRHAVELSLDAHMRAAETAGLALATGISRTCGTTNTVLSVAALIQGKPAHEEMVAIVDEIMVGHIRAELQSSTTGLASLWANPNSDISVFNLTESADGIRGGVAGTALVAADGVLMPTNSTDRFGMLILVGRGETGAPGSQRGFAEFCEGHPPDVSFEMSKRADILSVPSRWEWVVGEHTDLHAVEIIARKT